MKSLLTISVAIAIAAILPSESHGQSQSIPTGSLTVKNTREASSIATLDWETSSSANPEDLIEIKDSGTIVAKTNVKFDIRVIAVSAKKYNVTDSDWASYVYRYPALYRFIADISDNGAPFTTLFDGLLTSLNPDEILSTLTLSAGETLDFRGKCPEIRGSSHPGFSTVTKTPQTIVLRDQDDLATSAPKWNPTDGEDFLQPYTDAAGKISLGSQEIIYLMEITNSREIRRTYDFQDIIFLVNFEKAN